MAKNRNNKYIYYYTGGKQKSQFWQKSVSPLGKFYMDSYNLFPPKSKSVPFFPLRV